MNRIAPRLRQSVILCGSVLLVSAGVVVVLAVAPGPQLDSWVAATPAPEDREAYIRRLAREVMLPRVDGEMGSAAVPAAPETAASPSDDSPALATEPETPLEGAEVRFDDDAAWPNDTAGPATDPGEEVLSTPEFPSTSPSDEAELSSASQPDEPQLPSVSEINEPELPSVSQPNEDAADRATSSSESLQDSTEAVAGTE